MSGKSPSLKNRQRAHFHWEILTDGIFQMENSTGVGNDKSFTDELIVNRFKVDHIPIDKIIDVDDMPSKITTESIRKNGQLDPIKVTKRGDKYLVIDGKRRFKAMKMLGYEEVAVIIREANDVHIVKLTQNIIRSRNFPDEMESVSSLIESGFTEKEIASMVGCDIGKINTLSNMMKKLSPKTIEAAREGKISRAVANEMAKIPREMQDKILEEGATTAKEVKAIKKSIQLETLSMFNDGKIQIEDEELYGMILNKATSLAGNNRKILLRAAEIIRPK